MPVFALALPFDFEKPAWLWLVLLVPVLIAVSVKSMSGLEPVRRVVAIIIRSALVIILACCLAGIQHVQRNEDLTVMYVMDRSHSVQAMQDFQEDFVRRSTKDVPPADRVGLIDFARHAYLEQLPMTGGYFIPPGRLPQMAGVERTDIAGGLRLAMAMFPHDTSKRIVLLSDGNDNMGDVLTEARRAKADGIPIDVVPIRYQHRNEIYFDRMIAPTQAEKGEQVPLRMIVNTQRPAKGTISLYQNGKLVELSEEASRVALQPGNNTLFIKLPAQDIGAQTYEAVFRPDDESMDAVALNNSASAFTFVSGESRVLIITESAEREEAFVDGLRSENIEVVIREPQQLDSFDLLQMMTYSSIILSNVSAAVFTDVQKEQLATYVREGSGLIMLGGEESFGAGGWIGTPVEEVMPVSFEIKHKRVIPRGALVLIMHSCEMPRGNYWGIEMAKKSVDTVSSQDYLGVLAYTWNPGGTNWEVPLDLATNKEAVKNKIDRMQIGDMPDFDSTMEMAYKELTGGRGRDAAQKHVIIFSDGDPQPPSNKLISDYVKSKITVSTIGIGWGAHVMQQPLQKIAKDTGGVHYAPKNPKELPQIFVKESKVVRRPLIIDEPFVPRIVQYQSDVLQGINPERDFPPALGGMVLTSPKENPNVQIPMVRTTDDGDDPVLAHWQYELGKAVAFTSGNWPIWGEEWTSWPKFSKFWSQLVRWTMRQETPANFDTYTKLEGSKARIVVDALDKDASYLNFLTLQSNAIGPDNKPIQLKFTQSGPGKYEAEFDAEQVGQYLANVHIFDRGKHIGTLRTGLSAPFSPEYRDLKANEAVLRQIAEITAGRWLEMEPEQADIFSHDLPPTEAKRPAWEWVISWLLLPLFLLDVAVRRLANWLAYSIAVEVVLLVVLLFGLDMIQRGAWAIVGVFLLAELVGWTIRFRYIGPFIEFLTHGVMAQAGDRTASLGRLRGARERVRDKLSDRGDDSTATEAKQDEPPPTQPKSVAKRKFDAGESKGVKPTGDLSESLGGAKADETKPQPKSTPGDKPAADNEATTSRLLKAKKRARGGDDVGNV